MSEMKPVDSSEQGHEKGDINIRKVALYGSALLLIICLTGVLATLVFFKKLAGDQANENASPSPMLEAQPLPPEPRLQANPVLDLKNYRAAEDAQLNSYGWVDQANGVVRVPVDRALELVLQRGLPARSDARIEAQGTAESGEPQTKPNPNPVH